MSDDADISSQIRAFLTPKFAEKRFRLQFSYNGRDYTTQLLARHNANEIQVSNMCLGAVYSYELNEFLGNIQADTPELACFDPMLVSNARNNPGIRTTTTDVLSVLKIKLLLCFPVDVPIGLSDQAEKDTVTLTPFRILRGGDALYEKYGYRSVNLDMIKDRIRRARWGDLGEGAQELIRHIYTKSRRALVAADDTLLTDILRPITYEIENKYNRKYLNGDAMGFSAELCMYFLLEMPETNRDITNFRLDVADPVWLSWSTRLVFTGFEEIVAGGGGVRKTRRRRRSRSQV
jgi:hypothetical protein